MSNNNNNLQETSRSNSCINKNTGTAATTTPIRGAAAAKHLQEQLQKQHLQTCAALAYESRIVSEEDP